MNNITKSFLSRFGNIESWNTDRLYPSDGIEGYHGVDSVSFLRDLINDFDDKTPDDIKEEITYLNRNRIDYDESTPEALHEQLSFRTYTIPLVRIEKGYAAGLIDAVSNSYAKTDKGWVDTHLNVVADKNSSFEEILNLVREKAEIVDSFSVKDLVEAEEKEQLIVNKNIIASKNEQGMWINQYGKLFKAGEVSRIIAHSDEPAFTLMGYDEDKYYHGHASNKLEPEAEHHSRGLSVQGRAAYATGSINEAITYANPYGFETSGKLLSLQDSGEIQNRKDFVFSHIYELGPGLSTLFHADATPVTSSLLAKPSLSSLLLMTRLTGGNEIYVAKQWVDLINTKTSFDSYALMNNLNSYFMQHDNEFEALRKMTSSLGFDGLKVVFPTEKELSDIESKIEKFKAEFEIESYSDSQVLKNSLKALDKGMTSLKSAIPARAKHSHLILFEDKNLVKEHLKLLPFNEGGFLNQDPLYSQKVEMKKEDLLALKSPEVSDAKLYFVKRNEKENNVSFSLA
ncbi:hypothetical protein [Psychromonas sp. SP041]|uniref:hypothetical protein n=1 Tax=Psychromonas sp. SP041 TaxID=1365007 RepID=UPI0003FD2EFB|nr:hypothetical protein [Psychromonas sp. SP041]